MSLTVERFIRLYEDLVAEVNRRAGADTSHSFDIERAASRDGSVRKQQSLLKGEFLICPDPILGFGWARQTSTTSCLLLSSTNTLELLFR